MKNSKAKIGLVSISDRASSGTYQDKGIPSLKEWLAKALLSDYEVVEKLIPDEQPLIEATLKELCDQENCDLILTTGGTGPSRRDVTPEATLAVATRTLPGFGEQMRAVSLAFVPTAILSRQVGVLREIEDHAALIINLPGQPKAIAETLEGIPSKGIHGIFAAVPYCIDLIGGPALETRPNVVKAFRPKSAPQPHVIDAKIIDPKEGKADSAIIMLHGLILPTAPERAITANKGFLMRGWFDLLDTDGIGASDEPALVESARIAERLIALEETKGIRRDRIFLGGFSQGGCVALYTALKLDRPIGGIFCLSGYLPIESADDIEHVGQGILSPIFLTYGKEDNDVPPVYPEISVKELRKLGATDLWSKGYDGVGHDLCIEEVTDLSDFLEKSLEASR